MPVQVAVLDDYQEVARELAPWEQLEPEAEITFFHDHLLVDGVVRDLLEGFEVVVAMRERTPFTAKRLAVADRSEAAGDDRHGQRGDRHGRGARARHHGLRHRGRSRARRRSSPGG